MSRISKSGVGAQSGLLRVGFVNVPDGNVDFRGNGSCPQNNRE